MKNKYSIALFSMAAALAVSCSNGPTDTAKAADSANTAHIDSAKTADTIASKAVPMADVKPDAEFAVAAADGGMLEVALGKLAEKKGVSAKVKKFGSQMVMDHSKANKELETLAASKQITLPAGMSDKCQKKIAELDAKSGKDFDKAYIDDMVSDHKDDIDEFKKEAEKGHDTEISAWAKGKVPTLEHHLMMAEDAQKSLK